MVIIFAVVFVLAVVVLWVSKQWPIVKARIKSVGTLLGALLSRSKEDDVDTEKDMNALIKRAGYAYNAKKGIFYSRMNAWQRKFGYCRLYDEACAPLGMIVDCEPITFDYGGKRWMIEFWKGQYDFTTGCEVGVYTAARDVRIRGFDGTFYDCASDEDMLDIAMTLRKKGQTLLDRRGRHWWQTGFLLGVFSEPSELAMRISIKLKNRAMSDAFAGGLYRVGYTEDEIARSGKTVSLDFTKPRTPQPITRTPHTAYIMQWKNKLVCDQYQQITRAYDTMPKKLAAMREKAPEMFEIMMNVGRRKEVFDAYDALRGALR